MIVSKPQPNPAPAQPPTKKEPPAGMTHEQLCDLAAELKPTIVVPHAPPRLDEWVFEVHRNAAGQIARINAHGKSKGLTKG